MYLCYSMFVNRDTNNNNDVIFTSQHDKADWSVSTINFSQTTAQFCQAVDHIAAVNKMSLLNLGTFVDIVEPLEIISTKMILNVKSNNSDVNDIRGG